MRCKNRRHGIIAAAREVCNAIRHLGDGSRLILRQSVRGSIRAVRAVIAVRNTWAFLTETRFVADVCCDNIALGNTWYEHKLIGSTLSTTRFVSPGPHKSALSYTDNVRNSLMIVATARTLNLTALNWTQICSILQLSDFAIY